MPESVFAEKRTRSQVTLPDDILKLPQQSPLKNARIVQKSYATDVNASNPAEDTDDELLLSPHKEARTEGPKEPRFKPKRSASPPHEDEYLRRSKSPSVRRELKRARHGVSPVVGPNSTDVTNVQHALPRRLFTHSRNHSDPVITVGKRVTRKAASIKPSSFSNATPPPPSSPIAKGRAQSVPIFSLSYPILHVDLDDPPLSPRRARSRSPSKEHELKYRIVSGLNTGSILTPIIDETQGMDVDEDGVALLVPSVVDSSRLDCNSLDATPLQSDPLLTPSAQAVLNPPRTPATFKSTLLSQPLSPLTPLPETPYPPKLMMDADDRYIKSGWVSDPLLQPEHSEAPETHQPHESITGPTTSQSGLPRPSIEIAMKATTSKMLPPPIVSAGKVIKPTGSSSRSTFASNKANAFDLMMRKASDGVPNNDKGKGKAKRTTATSKPGPSALPKMKSDKGIIEEAKLSKVTLKAKMRARPQQRKRLILPTTFPPNGEESEVEETDDDLPVKSPWRRQRAPSPVPDIPVTFATTLPAIGLPGLPETITSDLLERDKPVHVPTNTESPTDDPITISLVNTIGFDPAPCALQTSTTDLEVYNPENPLENSKITPSILNGPLLAPKPEPPDPTGVNKSRLPFAKKRTPSTLPPRVTRSTSLKMKGADNVSLIGSRKRKEGFPKPPPPPTPVKTGSMKPKPSTDPEASTSSLSDIPTDISDDIHLVPGSPMKTVSPVRSPQGATAHHLGSLASSSFAKLDLSKTPSKSRIPTKLGTPSPNKIARSASMFVTRHTNFGNGARLFPADSAAAGGSSLSTLANALEKLKMPAPSRPNTSMGFNREIDDDNDQSIEVPKRSKDDGTVGMEGFGSGSLKRSATASLVAFDDGSPKAAHEAPETSKSVNGKQQSLVQKPVSMFFHKLRASGGPIVHGGQPNRPKIFGVGSSSGIFGSGARKPLAKASRKTSLPSVMASPVKRDGETSPVDDSDECIDGDAIGQSGANLDISMESNQTEITDALTLADFGSDNTDKKEKGKEKEQNIGPPQSPRRASLANALSRSTSSIPQPKGRGLMGPPATPPSTRTGMRSSSNTFPESISSPGRLSSGPTTRTSSRSAPSALLKIKGGINGHVSSSRKAVNESSETTSPKIQADSKILKDCVIFVDVKTDDGDEAGSLFVERLEEMGAKILTRVGQTCTQIVYKNGLASTLNRYRQLRDPKPFVVGIAWVVECVEQGRHLDETEFLVDLDEINITNKRRRSMLPKFISRTVSEASISDVEHEDGDGDRSMDGSVNLDDDLTPLEKARRRRSTLVGLKP